MREVSIFKLVVVLAVFFVVGSTMALFVWHTLSDFLAGHSVEGGAFLLAIGLIAVFIGFSWILGKTVRRLAGAEAEQTR